jgi:U3 small nucleolar RNA-associated protein 6
MERQIFTQAEVKAIIQRRRKFEYQMGRRTLKRVDVLRYITYELNLDQLRLLRKKTLSQRKTSVSW